MEKCINYLTTYQNNNRYTNSDSKVISQPSIMNFPENENSIVYFGLISFTIFIIGYIFRFKGMSIIAEYIISFKLCISCNTKVFIVVFMFMTMIYLLSKNVYSGMIYFVLFYNGEKIHEY